VNDIPTMLFGDWLPRYMHIERLGHADVEGLLDGEVIVQEKLDGANATVAIEPETGRLVIASRNSAVSVAGDPPNGFRGLVEYILGHHGLQMLAAVYIVRGEWLVPHSVKDYAPDTYKLFYVFDCQRYDTLEYVHPDEWMKVAPLEFGCLSVPTVDRLLNPTAAQIAELSVGPSALGAPKREGVVAKRYGFVNRFGRTAWGKVVAADFLEKNKLHMGANKHDVPELRFVAETVTDAAVLKVIGKTSDLHGKQVDVRAMEEVLGRLWCELAHEELVDWWMKYKAIDAMSLRLLKKLVYQRGRETALAYFNGAISKEGASDAIQ